MDGALASASGTGGHLEFDEFKEIAMGLRTLASKDGSVPATVSAEGAPASEAVGDSADKGASNSSDLSIARGVLGEVGEDAGGKEAVPGVEVGGKEAVPGLEVGGKEAVEGENGTKAEEAEWLEAGEGWGGTEVEIEGGGIGANVPDGAIAGQGGRYTKWGEGEQEVEDEDEEKGGEEKPKRVEERWLDVEGEAMGGDVEGRGWEKEGGREGEGGGASLDQLAGADSRQRQLPKAWWEDRSTYPEVWWSIQAENVNWGKVTGEDTEAFEVLGDTGEEWRALRPEPVGSGEEWGIRDSRSAESVESEGEEAGAVPMLPGDQGRQQVLSEIEADAAQLTLLSQRVIASLEVRLSLVFPALHGERQRCSIDHWPSLVAWSARNPLSYFATTSPVAGASPLTPRTRTQKQKKTRLETPNPKL